MMQGILLMAYGTPEGPEQVEAYYTHIRGGRAPSAESVEKLKARYALVGGRTPLLAITNAVCDALESELNAGAGDATHRVYVGMKHWHPFIGDVIPRIAADGITQLVALPLAPHYSRISIGGYQKAVTEAVAGLRAPMTVHAVDSWHLNPAFIALIADRVRQALSSWPPGQRAGLVTVFSAHSLPARIRQWSDPYEQQLLESCHAVAERAGIDNWRFAWQSAGNTGEPWLGPDIVDMLTALQADGVRHVLSVPVGFVSDHLEILYDLDHEAKGKADALGMTFRRIPMPNADPEFIRALASVVREAVSGNRSALEHAS